MTITEALQALAAPEPTPFRQVRWQPQDFVRWDEWNTRRLQALKVAARLGVGGG